ncbi:DUF3592 domain-containing protein [Flavobacterium columnare]|uniref:DUF3592 domain-containing protein n=2 Tax=Flavobacterium columnare TaxID=996 RepID=UPI003B9ED850
MRKKKYWIEVIAEVENVTPAYNNKGKLSEVKIRYVYIVKNKKYKNNKIAFGYRSNGVEDHETLFNKLKIAKKIRIYINPYNYSDSILVRGLNDSIIKMLIFSIMWNSLLSLFLIPLFTKENSVNRHKKNLKIVFIIWSIGFYLIFTKPICISIAEKIKIIENESAKAE